MRAIKIIFRRELGAYFKSPFSWILATIFLFLCGLLFQAQGLGLQQAPLSTFVLEKYFFFACICAFGLGGLLSFRLISEERQNNSMVLLTTSPVRDSEIVIGKFLAALVFLAFVVALSLYIPLMLKVGNKIALAQIMVGYFGLLLAGSLALAIGLFASALTRYQLVAAVIAFAILVLLGVLYQFARVLDVGSVRDILAELDMLFGHYVFSFGRGILNLKDVVYYVALTYFFLLLSIKTLEAKRWQ